MGVSMKIIPSAKLKNKSEIEVHLSSGEIITGLFIDYDFNINLLVVKTYANKLCYIDCDKIVILKILSD